jgi:hypothetical protein
VNSLTLFIGLSPDSLSSFEVDIAVRIAPEFTDGELLGEVYQNHKNNEKGNGNFGIKHPALFHPGVR